MPRVSTNPTNHIVNYWRGTITVIVIGSIIQIPTLIAGATVLSSTSGDRGQCSNTAIELNPWVWLLVWEVEHTFSFSLSIGSILRDHSYLVREGRPPVKSSLRTQCDAATSLFSFVWMVPGFIMASNNRISDTCPGSIRDMILAVCLIQLLAGFVVVAVVCLCAPCIVVVVLLVSGLKPVDAVVLSPEAVNRVLVDVQYQRPAGQDEPDACAICLVDYDTDERIKRITRCNHRFHGECITPWITVNNTCPLCRSRVGSGASGV
jgi:hypothetical protein